MLVSIGVFAMIDSSVVVVVEQSLIDRLLLHERGLYIWSSRTNGMFSAASVNEMCNSNVMPIARRGIDGAIVDMMSLLANL